MKTATVRIDHEGLALLDELRRETGQPAARVLRDALEALRRKRFEEALFRSFDRTPPDEEYRELAEGCIADGLLDD
jgi:hypothetical protein